MLKVQIVRGNDVIYRGEEDSNRQRNNRYSRDEQESELKPIIVGFNPQRNNYRQNNQPTQNNYTNNNTVNTISNKEMYNRLLKRRSFTSNQPGRINSANIEREEVTYQQPQEEELNRTINVDTNKIAEEVKPELERDVNINTEKMTEEVQPELEKEVNVNTEEMVEEQKEPELESEITTVNTEEVLDNVNEEIKENELSVSIDADKLKESMTNIHHDEEDVSNIAMNYLKMMDEKMNSNKEEHEDDYVDNEQVAKALGINSNELEERKPKKVKQKQMKIDFSNY